MENRLLYVFFKLKSQSLSNYLQLYPFSKMRTEDKRYLMSHEFYIKYIQYGSIIQFPDVMRITDNYLLKSDGSFRDSTLLSPVLFLVLQAIGKEISVKYTNTRKPLMSTYYSGNYEVMNAKYGKEYSTFYAKCKYCATQYDYFIKTDITNFFANINVDNLIEKIRVNCPNDFQLNQLKVYKDLLRYCGKGRFPLVESSIACSYLATIIYLNESDNKLIDYLNKLNIQDFKMIRYVDDLYIFSNVFDNKTFKKIRNQYSSYLKEEGLAINTKKTKLFDSSELENEIKSSFYGENSIETINGMELEPEDIHNKFVHFLNALNRLLEDDNLDYTEYKMAIEKSFENTSNLIPDEVFNKVLYDRKLYSGQYSIYQDTEVLNNLKKLLNYPDFFWVDPKRLFIMLLNTREGNLIKPVLSNLGGKKPEEWSFYDVIVAITYLTHRNTQYRNLYSCIKKKNKKLSKYLEYDYQNKFRSQFNDPSLNLLVEISDKDWISYYMYFEAEVESLKNNALTCYAWFKNYFDRMSANIEFYFNNKTERTPNYNGYYKEKQLKKVYKVINNNQQADKIIRKASRLRNSNPLTHATAELLLNLDNVSIRDQKSNVNPTSAELIKTKNALFQLLIELSKYYKMHK